MSVEKKIKYNGITVFWSLTDGTNIEVLRDGFEEIGWLHLLPEVQEDSQALRRALAHHFPGKRTLIRPLKGIVGYAVVNEDASGDEMEYDEEVRMGLVDGKLFSNPMDHPLREAVSDTYRFEKKLVTAAKLGGVLVRAARELNGIPLRPRGGFYWIPDSSAEKWEQIVDVVERARSGNVTWKMKTTTDENTVEAVCDSLVIQVENQLAKLESDLEEGELGKRALKTREKDAQELDSLVANYEEILGKTLEGLRSRASEVESAACVALLEAMAG